MPDQGLRRAKFTAGLVGMLPQRAVDFLYAHRFNPVVRRVRRLLPRVAGDPRDGTVVARGPLTGWRFAHADSFAMWMGRHEPELQEAVLDLAEPGQVAYDVGAHVGYMALLLASAVGSSGHVVAYEPDPESFAFLTRNIDLNEVSEYVEARCLALGRSAGRGRLQREEQSALTRVEGADDGSIDVSTLDAEVYERTTPPPDLLLLDIEGMEEDALRGGRRLLTERSPLVIAEHHGRRDALVTLLSPLGYQPVDLDPDHVLFRAGG